LNALSGGNDSTIAHSEDFEMSSSRETEYTVSPLVNQTKGGKKVHFGDTGILSDKSKRNRSIERTKRNITMNLREENERADLQLRLKKTQSGSQISQ